MRARREKTGSLYARLIDYLVHFRFSGEVNVMPEGTLFFSERTRSAVANAMLTRWIWKR